MKLGLWLRLIGCVGAYCGCGGSEFLVGVFPDGGPTLASEDAGELVDAQGGESQDAHPMSTIPSDGSAFKIARHDAGDVGRDAGDPVDSLAPAADSAGAPPPVDDAGDGTAPPPPALCCVTPCSGGAPAAITCGNGPAWTCAAGSCSARACALGAACNWMGPTCSGHVEVCP